MIQSESKGLRTRGAGGVNPSPRTGDEMRCPSSTVGQEKRGTKCAFCCFYSIWALTGLDDAHPHWGGRSTES